MWAKFDSAGCPAWFGPEPVAESAQIDMGELDPILATGLTLEEALISHRRNAAGQWVLRDPVVPPEPTAEEIAALDAETAAHQAEAEKQARKLTGVEFDGVMCSATSQDQAGLTAVLLMIQMQGAEFKPTRFEFENGSRLVISLANYRAFAEVWSAFRQSFFLA